MKRVWLLTTVLFLSACAGASPEPDYYMLHAVDGPTISIHTSIDIQRPVLPFYLDQSNIVQSRGNQISADEFRRWGEPLDTMGERLLAEDLRQRMPASVTTMELDNIAPQPRFTLNIEIQTFNAADGRYVLNAQLMIKDNCSCRTAGLTQIPYRAETSGDDVEAMSALLGQLADKIAAILQTRLSEEDPKNQQQTQL